MPFGAHETMEVHECLMEKVNMLNQFNFYLKQAKNPRLVDMIIRHQQEEIRSYNEVLAYTHDYNRFSPISPNTNIRGIEPQQIHYGVQNPPPFQPESSLNQLGDKEVAIGMLLCHKNAARNSMWATLETADPNLRKLLLNCAVNCSNQAFEVFLFMNQNGMYQVPEMNSDTAKTLLHSYVPTGKELENTYFGHQSQNTAFSGQAKTGQGNYNFTGSNQGMEFNVNSPQSALYGGNQEAGRQQYPQGGLAGQGGNKGTAPYGNQNYRR
ncbi:spore coat protein CotF [Peribacillus deserti]|uniref:Spore coat protein CotF n=1 Tax=Peribacillus deserti TaxID=673318 RepID=A0ABS2QCY4_9BACI|nr:spore coat protein [Peribacillus deserti]MBM7691003.1 spore coat protein CotF [Peribacillus deserti]